ncbi:MAG: primosomal protein N' [Lachnospiraceae bacterium]|nr:primosomal protein N' [Lachnospiraceae bacterium]
MIFADVIIDISVKSLDRPFQYIVAPEMEEEIEIGSLVKIPFGMGNRIMKGYVIGLSGEALFDISRMKSIIEVEKQGVVAESHLLSLAYWIKENYGSTMNDAIKAVMPVKREVKELVKRTIYPNVSREEMTDARNEFEKKHNSARVRLLNELLCSDKNFRDGIDYSYAHKNLKVSSSVINGLKDKKLIIVDSFSEYRNPIGNQSGNDDRHVLNQGQKHIVDSVMKDYVSGIRKTYLIHGVTGSGKTEVYMNIIEKVLLLKKQVIMLIPEIALTYQTVSRFYKRFGNRVSVMHSKLSAGERYDQYTRARNGDIDVMIGPRSALFAPFQNLGLIVIDEEHETSYRSETPPKYHAREVAIKRASMTGASVILGSATPSVESYYNALNGKYELFTLEERAGGAKLPEVQIVDLREELAAHNYSIFSRSLKSLIEDRLERHEQIILFINRRGYAGFVSCRKCGKVIGCPHCSVSLKPHSIRGKVTQLKCHYCGYSEPMPAECPDCHSKYIGTFGLGTQQVEEMVRKTFDGARVLRMDADTTSGKDGHENILKQFEEGEADILIGTQMIVKGHDFPNVTLVGILAADLSLNVGDYRASERTFQLLSQAAGRAGRAKKPGKVVMQTYQPEHYSITSAAAQNYEEFYEKEITTRQMLQYPPISNILGVLVLSVNEASADNLAQVLCNKMKIYEDVTVLGPTEASISKANDVYRRVVYGKCADYNILCSIKNQFEEYMKDNDKHKDCRLIFEFN